MADTDGAEEGPGPGDLEAPEDNQGEEDILIHLSKYSETRRALPWEQLTLREKANFYIDRIFLGLLILFLLMLMGECCYKVWYVTNVKKIAEFVSESVVLLFNWLFTQDKQEHMFEL